jgi:SOS-response transcriptional repressor LexA
MPIPSNLRSEDVYDAIIAYKSAHDGNSPTLRQLGAACGIASTFHVSLLLTRLEENGLIKRTPFKPCSIQVVGATWHPPEVE